MNAEQYINDTLGLIELYLPLGIVNGTTEIDMDLIFTIGSKTTAQKDVDMYGFYSCCAILRLTAAFHETFH